MSRKNQEARDAERARLERQPAVKGARTIRDIAANAVRNKSTVKVTLRKKEGN